MPNLRTMVTELGTGLGMLGHVDLAQALARRTPVMRNLSPETWDQLASARSGGQFDAEFHAAWENGRAFLEAREGLRGRSPEIVEWKGAIRAIGDEVAPIDLRIDHVYLVSCKYLSNILFNVSPTHLFDDLLVGGQGSRGRGMGGDWYAQVAPAEYQDLYEIVRRAVRQGSDFPDGDSRAMERHSTRSARSVAGGTPALPGFDDETGNDTGARTATRPPTAVPGDLPRRATELNKSERTSLGMVLRAGWPDEAKAAYGRMSAAVAVASVTRWRSALSSGRDSGEAMVWRLLRMGTTPYFILGSSETQSLRLRIATPWDWRQRFALTGFDIFVQEGGQSRVGWTARVRDRVSAQQHDIAGHVEVRWSHGRFGGPPEAKGYVDTAHHHIPGYFPLQ